LKNENLSNTRWGMKILERLARLSPETYGKSFYLTKRYQTDAEWIFHTDSVRYWNAADPHGEGWQQVTFVSPEKEPVFSTGNPKVVWGDDYSRRIFLWRNAFFNGIPREGKIYFACSGKFRLYLNEKLLVSDTSTARPITRVDSISDITAMLKGGDNIIAMEVIDDDTVSHGAAIVLSALLDTSQRFTSKAIEPRVRKIIQTAEKMQNDSAASATPDTTAGTVDTVRAATSYAQQFKNKGELMRAIEDYRNRERATNIKMRKERLEVQKLNMQVDAMNAKIRKVKEEIAQLRKMKSTMTREK